MQNNTLTSTEPLQEHDVTDDWAVEALALAERVNYKLRQPAPVNPQPVVADEYEPQSLGDKRHSGRLLPR